MRFAGDILKWDEQSDGTLIISGIASTQDLDAQGEIVSADAMRKALPEYLRAGSVREMHQPIAAGRPLSAFVDDEGKTHLEAKIVDKGTCQKIKEKVLKAFSIGGKSLSKTGNTITSLSLREISVVDIGANPNATFDICKFDDNPPKPMIDHKFLAKTFGMPDTVTEEQVMAEFTKRLTPATPSDDIAKLSKSIEDLKKSVPTIPADVTEKLTKLDSELTSLKSANAAAELAVKKANIDALVVEASREGKVIPFENDELYKMDVPVVAKMISKLTKTVATTTRTSTAPPADKDGKELTGAELTKWSKSKRAEGAAELTKLFAQQGIN